MELSYGVIRGWRRLDWMRSRLVPRKPRPALDALALIGLHQLLFMEGMQDYAAVHETVEAARASQGAAGAGFINALLRRAQAEREALMGQLRQQPPGIRLSHPDLLLDRWTGRYGADAARRLCEWNNTPPLTVAAADRQRPRRVPRPASPDRP